MKDYLKLLPLLVLYVTVVLTGTSKELVHDELRYAAFAENLTHGYYSPPDTIRLAFGPGLPLVLALFKLLGVSWVAAKGLNAVLLYGSVAFFFATLKEMGLGRTTSLRISYLFGVYPPFLRWLPLFMSENLAVFLVCGFMLCYCKSLRQTGKPSRGFTVLAGVLLGYLALTKVFFGYVTVTFLVACLVAYALGRDRQLLRASCIATLAMILCLPYLAYTYRLTSKMFYWGTTGGAQLYWMTSPHDEEYGDWFPYSYESLESLGNAKLLDHHGEFFKTRTLLNEVEMDGELRRQALQQLKAHPARYVRNWIANLGRLYFNYPYSYEPQKLSTYFFLLPNMFIVVLSTLCLYPTWIARKTIPLPILTLLAFAAITIGGGSLLSAYARFLVPVVPILSLWIGYVFSRVLSIRLQLPQEASSAH